jgi:alpha-L-rhamnosidase
VAGFERFWDDERSVYVDHLVDGERRRPVSQHGSAAALCAGLAEAGRPELVAGMCRDWSVFLDRGETSWPETWFGGTHCHGWSSTPTRDLVVRTLGITPAEPGFAVACVAPRLGDLDWAAGAAPTPRGLVTVRADIEKVEVDSPVPVAVDLGHGAVRRLAAGSHTVARDALP